MAKRQVWVVEVADRGENNWSPMYTEASGTKRDGLRLLRSFADPPRERWEYQLTRYVAQRVEPTVCAKPDRGGGPCHKRPGHSGAHSGKGLRRAPKQFHDDGEGNKHSGARGDCQRCQ